MWAYLCNMQMNIGVALMLVCGLMFVLFTLLYGIGYVIREKIKEKIGNRKESYESVTSEVSEPTVWESRPRGSRGGVWKCLNAVRIVRRISPK